MAALAPGQMQTPESQASLCATTELSIDWSSPLHIVLCQGDRQSPPQEQGSPHPNSDPCDPTEWLPCVDPESGHLTLVHLLP